MAEGGGGGGGIQIIMIKAVYITYVIHTFIVMYLPLIYIQHPGGWSTCEKILNIMECTQ